MHRLRSSSYPFWTSVLIILIIGLVLYAPSAGLMLFSDDAPHMQWLSNQHGGSYWLSSAGFPVYRPATFAVWDALVRLLGGPNALVFHSLSIVLHLANGLLVSELAYFFTRRRGIGLLAGVFFVAFPFSYGAVILAAAQFHVWQTFGLLAGVRLMLGWLERQSNRWGLLVLAWLLAGGAIFQHENGVLVPVLAGGVLISRLVQTGGWKAIQENWRRLAVALGPVAGLAAVYLVLRSMAIEGNAGEPQLAGLAVKLGLTLQVIDFPLAALFRLIFNPQNGLILAWIGGAFALIAASLLAFRWRKIGGQTGPAVLIVLGGGWTLIAMLPAWVFVPIDYLLGSVRLHYLASAGIAWMWAAVLAGLPESIPQWHRRAIGGLGLAVWLAIAVPFVWARQAEFRTMDIIYRDAGVIAGRLADGDTPNHTHSLMVLNGPSSMTPPGLTFLLGSEGSVYLPDYVSLESLLWVDGFISEQHPLDVEMRRASDVSPPLAVDVPDLDRGTLRTYDAVAAVQVLNDRLRAVLVGQQPPDQTGDILADFGNGVILESGMLERVSSDSSWELGGSVPDIVILQLDWRVASPPQPAEVFVHLTCDDNLITQADGPPLGRVYPFALWLPGERWRDIRYLALPLDETGSCLSVVVGLYDPTTGNRLTIVDGASRGLDGVTLRLEENGISGHK
jgi:hypothetical protein